MTSSTQTKGHNFNLNLISSESYQKCNELQAIPHFRINECATKAGQNTMCSIFMSWGLKFNFEIDASINNIDPDEFRNLLTSEFLKRFSSIQPIIFKYFAMQFSSQHAHVRDCNGYMIIRRGGLFTFVGLSVGDLQVEIAPFANLFLLQDGFLQVSYRYVEPIEGYSVIRKRGFKFIMHWHHKPQSSLMANWKLKMFHFHMSDSRCLI